MLIKQGACAIKSGKWALMAMPLAAPVASMPFRTYGQRYISTLIRVALHRCLWKYFHNFPLPLLTLHCLQIGGEDCAGLSGTQILSEAYGLRWGKWLNQGKASLSRYVCQGDMGFFLTSHAPYGKDIKKSWERVVVMGVWWTNLKGHRELKVPYDGKLIYLVVTLKDKSVRTTE